MPEFRYFIMMVNLCMLKIEDKKKVGRVARHTRRELRSNLLRSCLKVQVVFNQLCQNKENKSER